VVASDQPKGLPWGCIQASGGNEGNRGVVMRRRDFIGTDEANFAGWFARQCGVKYEVHPTSKEFVELSREGGNEKLLRPRVVIDGLACHSCMAVLEQLTVILKREDREEKAMQFLWGG
jgi:hypothetical protein